MTTETLKQAQFELVNSDGKEVELYDKTNGTTEIWVETSDNNIDYALLINGKTYEYKYQIQ